LTALIEGNVGCFCFTQRKTLTPEEYLELLERTLDEMEQRFADNPRPFLHGVARDGTMWLLYP
jgi:hypothetical protein